MSTWLGSFVIAPPPCMPNESITIALLVTLVTDTVGAPVVADAELLASNGSPLISTLSQFDACKAFAVGVVSPHVTTTFAVPALGLLR